MSAATTWRCLTRRGGGCPLNTVQPIQAIAGVQHPAWCDRPRCRTHPAEEGLPAAVEHTRQLLDVPNFGRRLTVDVTRLDTLSEDGAVLEVEVSAWVGADGEVVEPRNLPAVAAAAAEAAELLDVVDETRYLLTDLGGVALRSGVAR